ncbi:MAG: gliding motility-associated C-terminal domain-containing protein, partial [Bacteroidales bacterium]
VPNSYKIRWTTDNPEASNPSSSLITRVNNPPYADTWYKLTVTDLYGIIRSDSVFYESIQTKADLTPEYVSLNDSVEYPENHEKYGFLYDSLSYSAPGKYRFDLSGSKNLSTYVILFGDGDTLISSVDDTLVVVHEYQKPGVYKVVLTTRSEENCIDSVGVTAELKSAFGEGPFKNFTLPNVITPNADNRNDRLVIYERGEGGNDIFRSEDVSVLVIDISIFDRVGHKVYSYAGSIREWEGWNGLIRDSNRQAPEGVYFYVITLLDAYNDKEYPIGEKVKRGFFHLYRE